MHGCVVWLQEVEKEVWEKDASGKRKMKLVQETEYCYEADMEGAWKSTSLLCCLLLPYIQSNHFRMCCMMCWTLFQFLWERECKFF